jgi:hypothetical protein
MHDLILVAKVILLIYLLVGFYKASGGFMEYIYYRLQIRDRRRAANRF